MAEPIDINSIPAGTTLPAVVIVRSLSDMVGFPSPYHEAMKSLTRPQVTLFMAYQALPPAIQNEIKEVAKNSKGAPVEARYIIEAYLRAYPGGKRTAVDALEDTTRSDLA